MISQRGSDLLAEAVVVHDALEEVNLSENEIRDVAAWADALLTNSSVAKLDLGYCGLGASCAQLLAAPALSDLRLDGNDQS